MQTNGMYLRAADDNSWLSASDAAVLPVTSAELPHLPSLIVLVRRACPIASLTRAPPPDAGAFAHAVTWHRRILDLTPVDLHRGRLWQFLAGADGSNITYQPPTTAPARSHPSAKSPKRRRIEDDDSDDDFDGDIHHARGSGDLTKPTGDEPRRKKRRESNIQ